ncbi:MAG: glycosyltransferase WbuB [Acidobacteria bacterium]|nr:MAG: glycosyltransferase WbuB [Acidobacteriota bacterium]
MRILLLTSYFPPEIGSASHLFHDIGAALVERGHEVEVITGIPSYHAKGRGQTKRFIAHESMTGMDVTRVWVPQIARDTPAGRGFWQLASAAAFAAAAFRRKRSDAVLVYSPPLTLGLTALMLRVFRRVPFVINVQDLFPQSAIDLGILRQPFLIKAARWLERFLYSRAEALSFHSRGNLEHAVGVGADRSKCEVVHNCVDTAHLESEHDSTYYKGELGLEGHFIASFAGVMGYSQDLDVILETAKMFEDDEEVAFLLVGDGVEKERLVAKADSMDLPNVVWMPMQPRGRYPRILHSSDVCLTTLEAEVKTPVVPSKIISAMAAGRPVIAALDPNGDAPALLQEVGCGVAIAPEDPVALADAISLLRAEPDLREKMGSEGRRFAEEHCSPESVAAQYEKIFERIAGSGS